MVGKGVLLECLEDHRVSRVLLINRRPVGINHPKVTEIIRQDFFDFTPLIPVLQDFDVCFFCLGVSSVGMKEDQYKRITYDLTLSFARAFYSANSNAVFLYISGTGTDGTEKGRIMWARVKGMTENAILSMGFRDAYAFRPGYIQPMKGVRARSNIVNVLYVLFKPVYWILKPFSRAVTNSVALAKAMINAADKGYDEKVVEMKDIGILARNNSI